MPEDMPDRMPEDLPVTKRIDVMVGIIRNKPSSYWGSLGPPQALGSFQSPRLLNCRTKVASSWVLPYLGWQKTSNKLSKRQHGAGGRLSECLENLGLSLFF